MGDKDSDATVTESFRGDLSHTTVNATEQTDGKGLYETEGRARLKEGGFLGPEDQSVSVCERV